MLAKRLSLCIPAKALGIKAPLYAHHFKANRPPARGRVCRPITITLPHLLWGKVMYGSMKYYSSLKPYQLEDTT
jgi:hypothetical protein